MKRLKDWYDFCGLFIMTLFIQDKNKKIFKNIILVILIIFIVVCILE